MADQVSDVSSKPQSEGALTWMQHNLLDPMLNSGPLGIYNTVADLTNLPECHLAVDKATPYSADWFAQSLSGGVGYVLPYVLAAAGTGAAMRATDSALAGSKIAALSSAGESLSPILQSQRVAMIAGAAGYAGLQKPEDGHTRLGNAVGTGLGFLIFDQGNMLSKSLDLPLAARIASYPVVGFLGGAAMSEGSQFFSNGKLASGDLALQSGVQGMTLNSLMPLAQEGLGKLTGGKGGSDSSTVEGNQAPDTPAPGKAAAVTGDGQDGSPRIATLVTGDGQDGGPRPAAPVPGDAQSIDLAGLSRSYSDWVKDNQPSYPDPEDFDKLTPEEIVNRGFVHPDTSEADFAPYKDHGPRPLPNPDVVASEVGKSMADMPLAKDDGPLTLGEWNMEFLTGDKAQYFAKTYGEVVPRVHLLTVEEANEDGLAQIAKDNGYDYAISRENSRGQAVGFLVNPRLKVLGTDSYDNVADVNNIPDLRPAFRIDLQDTATGDKFSAVAVHLKSMRGGPENTSPVRAQQATILANDLGSNYSGIVAGDWNTFLDNTHDLDGLKNAGFKTLDPTDHTSTQSMGGRLDGFLYKNLNGTMTDPVVRPFFQNPLITRGLSDHGLLTTTLTLNSTPRASAQVAAPVQ